MDDGASQAELEVNDLKVYPNPATEYILLEYLPKSNKATWELYDALGRKVMEKQLMKADRHRFILNKNLSSGLYFWVVKNGSELVGSGKLMVKI